MPGIITHNLLAETVIRDLTDDKLKAMIKANHHAFRLGVNGPDFLYFINSLPWSDQKVRKSYTALANEIHKTHINDFYHLAFKIIKKNNESENYDKMIAYLAGHLCHWVLDSITHPFIFYRTNGTTADTKYWHYRYESMIDIYMYDHLKSKQLLNLPSAALLNHDSLDIDAIAKLYIPIVKEIWSFELDVKTINRAFKDFYTVLLLSYDPVGIWYHIIRGFELIKNDEWNFTSHFITNKKDLTRDILNINHQKWSNPCDCSDVHHESFIDLFDQAHLLGIKTLNELQHAIATNKDNQLLTIIDNRSYDTNHREFKSMKYFDPIY